MRLLVPGCAGFIGSHFLERILARDEVEVVGWDGETDKIEHLLGHPRLTLRQRLLKRPEAYAVFEKDLAASDHPAAGLKQRLLALCEQPQSFGRRQSVLPFVQRQLGMQWRKRSVGR